MNVSNHVIPFSLGKRRCVGEVLAKHDLFLLITKLVQRFKVLPGKGESIDVTRSKPGFLREPIAHKLIFIDRDDY